MGPKKRLTLDLDPEFQKRLKVTAAMKGVSMREYCERAIEKELEKDWAEESERRADLSINR
jgi:predicted HicB family RNase H-like nuclease